MNKYSCEETSQGLLVYCYYEDKKISSLIEREKINHVKKLMSLSSDYYLKELAKKEGVSAIKRAIDKIEEQIYQLDSEKQAKEYFEEQARKKFEWEEKLREERQKAYQRQQELENLRKDQEEQKRLAPLRKINSEIELLQSTIKTKETKFAELESIHSQGSCDQSCQEELEGKKKNLAEFRSDLINLLSKKKELAKELNIKIPV